MIKLNSILKEIKVNQPAGLLIANLKKAIKTDLEYHIDNNYTAHIDFDSAGDIWYDVFEKTYKHPYDENNDEDYKNWGTLQDLFFIEAEEILSKKHNHPIEIEIER